MTERAMDILDPIAFPAMMRVRQHFDRRREKDVAGAVIGRIMALAPRLDIRPGQRVALACPSRGLADYPLLVQSVVSALRALRLDPFIVPAMGSHGAATAEGQKAVLARLGITEDGVGAPIRSQMEVVRIGEIYSGVPVNIDRLAFEADHIVPINRIKEHNGFEAEIQSGLMKIMVIGLGKTEGAKRYHQAMVSHGYYRVIVEGARTVMANSRILFGVASIENAYHQVAEVGVFAKDAIEAQERVLLSRYKAIKARLPFDFAHVLIIEEVGKEISGRGFDTKVVGRIGSYLGPDPETPDIRRIMVCDLTETTHGNATGLGPVDVITRRLYRKIDHAATTINYIVGAQPEIAKTPLIMENDRDALRLCMMTVGLTPPAEQKIMRIKNTLCLDEVAVSHAFAPALEGRGDLEVIRPPRALEMDREGNFKRFADSSAG